MASRKLTGFAALRMQDAEIINGRLMDLLNSWQKSAPEFLLSSADITREATAELSVSRPTVSRHLTEAVARGQLLEVLVRRDWLVVMPEPTPLPPLYAAVVLGAPQELRVYTLTDRRPASRGSDGVSFLITPSGFEVFVRHQSGIWANP